MDPSELAEYLRVFKSAGCAAARIVMNGSVSLEVTFAPEMPDMPDFGSAPTPGGWKSPSRLDDPFDLNPPDPQGDR